MTCDEAGKLREIATTHGYLTIKILKETFPMMDWGEDSAELFETFAMPTPPPIGYGGTYPIEGPPPPSMAPHPLENLANHPALTKLLDEKLAPHGEAVDNMKITASYVPHLDGMSFHCLTKNDNTWIDVFVPSSLLASLGINFVTTEPWGPPGDGAPPPTAYTQGAKAGAAAGVNYAKIVESLKEAQAKMQQHKPITKGPTKITKQPWWELEQLELSYPSKKGVIQSIDVPAIPEQVPQKAIEQSWYDSAPSSIGG